jgi:peptide/nickel transport system substrate-binding protein
MKKHRVRPRVFVVGLLGVAVAASCLATATYAASSRNAAGHKCVVATGSGDQPFTKNWNPYAPGVFRDFAQGGVYEQLVISTAFGGGHVYPMLARSYKFSTNGKMLTLNITPNARWADGSRLTMKDVLYSLTIGRQDKLADKIGLVSEKSNIKSVKQVGKKWQVQIKFKAVDSNFVAGGRLSSVFVVKKANFVGQKSVVDYANPKPNGSGPFNRLTRFNATDYVLSKNTKYWQKGLPKVPCIERISALTNDAALLQIVNGDADWTHNFVPNVEKAYIAKDKAHYHSSYLPVGTPVSLVFDTTKYPYSIVGFRKGVSMAINRKDVSKLGEYGYAPPTNALGIEYVWNNWINPKLKAQAKTLGTYNPTAAKKAFTAAHFTYKGSKLYDPKGDRVSFEMHVIAGWSDWVASLQIIAKNLKAVGIDASVKLDADWSVWQPAAMSSKVVTLLWSNGADGLNPYGFYYSNMDPSQNVGSGNDASTTGNWEHFQSVAAASLLKQMKGTLDRKKQLAAVYKLEKIWLDNLPIIPLFVGPRWSTYSTKYWTGFPTSKDPYVDPIFSTGTQAEQILLRLKPVK